MSYEDIFRALALGEIDVVSGSWRDLTACVGSLDRRSSAIGHLGALIALGANGSPMAVAVDAAIGAGVTADELVAVLVDLTPVVGTARAMEAAPAIGIALDIDVERLLELE